MARRGTSTRVSFRGGFRRGLDGMVAGGRGLCGVVAGRGLGGRLDTDRHTRWRL